MFLREPASRHILYKCGLQRLSHNPTTGLKTVAAMTQSIQAKNSMWVAASAAMLEFIHFGGGSSQRIRPVRDELILARRFSAGI
ncbi:MAG: hypothetical protein JXA73_09395, partial [Acidobacteria bacterium]|nr:hypothetical protein [Acidobacteriota bacterium]